MKFKTLRALSVKAGTLALALTATALAQTGPDPALPHLEKRGVATQLIVDGQPFLVLGGETANTASSSLDYMAAVWPRLARLHLNTALVGIAWDWIEPVEGQFDFTLVDGMLRQAREQKMRVVIVWFGSWKNGISSFVPAWVKRDQARFPRVRIASGKSIEIVTPLSEAGAKADARAYVKLMTHLREVDAQHTVIMVQIENEVGVLGDSRDRSDAANAAFAGPVPAPLLSYLAAHQTTLGSDLAKLWRAAGAKTTGTWTDVFGTTTATDEIFMAWHYATYMNNIAAAGKAVLPLPTFTNTWIVQPEDKGPGSYPSGGPEPLVLDIWKAGAPSIDLNCPDIYLPNFTEWVARFHRADNPLFVPESRGDAGGVANAFYAIGQHAALGYSPFGIDNTGRLVVLRPDPGQPQPTDLENLPLAKGYAVLRDLTPLILEHQAKGTIAAVSLNTAHPTESIALGDYTLNVDVRRNRRNPTQAAALGYAMVFNLGPDEYLVAGCDIQVTFSPRTPGPEIAGLASVEAGSFSGGRWVPGRKLSGDDILLNYDLAAAAAANQSGSGLQFGPDGPALQRVKLYRYQ